MPKQITSPSREIRTITSTAQPMSVRTTADGSRQIGGYAIVFDSRSVDLGGFTEIVGPQSLKRTLSDGHPILALRDHRSELLLGNTGAGTLELSTDSKGLAFKIALPQTDIGDDTFENVRLGNLFGVSFSFNLNPENENADKWEQDAEGNVTRTLLDIDLYEVSPTSFAAYPQANVSVNARSCPVDLLKRLTTDGIVRSDGVDDDDDIDDPNDLDCDGEDSDDPRCEDSEDRCDCRCAACQGDEQRCEACSALDCDDEKCSRMSESES